MEALGSCRVLYGVAVVLLCFATSALARPCNDGQKPVFFFFPSFDNPAAMADLTLLGDARVSDGHDGVMISGSEADAAGQLFFVHPVGLKGPLSFSTSFTFSMAGGGGDGLAFVIAPSKDFPGSSSSRRGGAGPGPWLGFPSERDMAHTLAVEFDTKMDEAALDPNGNHVGLDVGSFVSLATANASDVSITLNGGQEMRAWVDYHAASQTLQVRLSESSGRNHLPPPPPLLSYRVDLSLLWNDKMYVGFTSSTGSPRQKHILHSWDFAVLRFPPGMHSIPVNPFQSWHGPDHEQHGHEYQWQRSGQPGYWHGNWGAENQHPRFGQHVRLRDIGRVAIGLLLGAICGAIFALALCLLIAVVTKLVRKSNLGTKKSSFAIFGYQKLPTTETATVETLPPSKT